MIADRLVPTRNCTAHHERADQAKKLNAGRRGFMTDTVSNAPVTQPAAAETAPLGGNGTASEGGEAAISSTGLAEPMFANALQEALGLAERGGPVIWLIGGLSVLTVAIILWKFWRLAISGAWRRARAEEAVRLWLAGKPDAAASIRRVRGPCAQTVWAAMAAIEANSYDVNLARDEATRVAKRFLADASKGLRALELIGSIAPLLGLFGTVLGMIAAFQALQATGARADPAALAGGIWEALLTTAAGMAVAIPAVAALTWFEGIIARLRHDMEDMVSRILTHAATQAARRSPIHAQAAE